MPADDYAPVVRGALKLKGSAPSGIKKKKKKPKTSNDSETATSSKKSALQAALEEKDAESGKAVVKGKRKSGEGEEEVDEEKLRELEDRGGNGKTASERAYEEMRRKRVCTPRSWRCCVVAVGHKIMFLLGFSANMDFPSYMSVCRRRASRRISSVWRN